MTARAVAAPGPRRKAEPHASAAKNVLTPDVVRVTEDMEVHAVARLLGHGPSRMPRSSTGRAASWGSSPSATSWITP